MHYIENILQHHEDDTKSMLSLIKVQWMCGMYRCILHFTVYRSWVVRTEWWVRGGGGGGGEPAVVYPQVRN